MCAFPHLFSSYSEIIMQNIKGYPGIEVVGHNVNNLRYTDDTVLIAENKEDLQRSSDFVEEKEKKKVRIEQEISRRNGQSKQSVSKDQHLYGQE